MVTAWTLVDDQGGRVGPLFNNPGEAVAAALDQGLNLGTVEVPATVVAELMRRAGVGN